MKAPIKILIVEDEALIADNLAMHLEDLGYQVVHITDNAEDTFEAIKEHQPDLILVDINIQGALDGVDVANTINQRYQKPFVYLTSDTSKATIERVKYTKPAGFLVKPYRPKDLETTIEIALHNYETIQKEESASNEEEKDMLLSDSFFVKDKHALVRVYFDDILYVKALDNYAQLMTKQQKYVVSYTLKKVEAKLLNHGFMRIHRSYLVNLKHISKIGFRQVFIDKEEIPISESQKQELLKRISLF
ncbi:MAG: response regulator transcription factor [Aureispira sp.]|nr:response regulator transcription factor [Aureispira sp.]